MADINSRYASNLVNTSVSVDLSQDDVYGVEYALTSFLGSIQRCPSH